MLRSGPRLASVLQASYQTRQTALETFLCPLERRARSDAADDDTPPKGTGQRKDYYEGEGPVKEDFIDTPLPSVSEEAMKDPKKWPHQDDKERRHDLDVPDEGEAISKTPGFKPHTDPNATPDFGAATGRRTYHVMTAHRGAFSHRIRELHSSDIFLAEKAKHPDDKHAEELARDHNNNDPASGNLPGNFDNMPPETDAKDFLDPSRLQDPEALKERRRSKDPEYYDRVHGSNPAQQRESFAEEAERNAHAARRAGREDTISAEGDRTPAST